MFGFFKKKGMKVALEECQSRHKEIGLGQELSSDMFEMVIQTSLFRDIDARFKSNGLSQYGGLAWFCSQIVGTIRSQLEQGEQVEDSMYELAEKMSTVALLLANSIHSLQLTQNDMKSILNAGEIANQWLKTTRTEGMEEFLETVLKSS
ncbi:hypothetical protein [Vibrio diabolicus]|uniref:hypothetical protein n=1 Tax=Vibrio diabolicus TaxID=50719 RepID=UPI0037528B42